MLLFSGMSIRSIALIGIITIPLHIIISIEVVEYSGIEKMFNEAGVYYDNLAKKVEAVNSPQNKVVPMT